MKKSDRKHVNWTLRGADNNHYSSLILVLFFCVCVCVWPVWEKSVYFRPHFSFIRLYQR